MSLVLSSGSLVEHAWYRAYESVQSSRPLDQDANTRERLGKDKVRSQQD